MEKEIIMVTGGQRSGKSMFAEKLALERGVRPVYVATAEPRDEEFHDRVRRHRQRRGDRWDTVEEQLHVGSLRLQGRVALIDCITMLATNHFFACRENLDEAVEAVCDQLRRLMQQDAVLIFVTNEIGLGGISGNRMQRTFTDMLGLVNKYLAQHADTVYLMVSGIPMKIKPR